MSLAPDMFTDTSVKSVTSDPLIDLEESENEFDLELLDQLEKLENRSNQRPELLNDFLAIR